MESQGMSHEKNKPTTTASNSHSPKMKQHNSKIRVKFKGSSLKQDKIIFAPRNTDNLFIVYELDSQPQYLEAYFSLKDCLFGAVN